MRRREFITFLGGVAARGARAVGDARDRLPQQYITRGVLELLARVP
jgi:hypothetical protein